MWSEVGEELQPLLPRPAQLYPILIRPIPLRLENVAKRRPPPNPLLTQAEHVPHFSLDTGESPKGIHMVAGGNAPGNR